MKKKLLSLLLVLCMLCGLIPATVFSTSAIELSGECGDGVWWDLDYSTCVLTIGGNGVITGDEYWGDYDIYPYIWDVIILDGVTGIDADAFFHLRNVSTIRIGKDVEFIDSGAFSMCEDLYRIRVDSENLYYFSSPDGVLYNKDKTELLRVPRAYDEGLAVPDSVKYIRDYACSECRDMADVILPDGITSIGRGAFHSCINLMEIELPMNLESIGDFAFESCANLSDITIPAKVKEIGDTAFGACENLKHIFVEQGNQYFTSDEFGILYNVDKTSLIRCPQDFTGALTIPDSVEHFANGAFEGCEGIDDLYISDLAAWCEKEFEDDGAYEYEDWEWHTVDSNPLSYADNLYIGGALVTELEIPESVTQINDYAFYNCDAVTAVTIPGGMKRIGKDAFFSCGSLTKVNLSDLGAWCEIEFASLDSNPLCFSTDSYEGWEEEYSERNLYLNGMPVTELVFPEGVEHIQDYAFYGCESLITVEIPDGVKSVGDYAFYGCSRLTAVTIPESVESVGAEAFGNCAWLTSIHLGSQADGINEDTFANADALRDIQISAENEEYTVDEYGVLYNKDKTVLIKCPWGMVGEYVIPDGVVKICDGAFHNQEGLTGISIPDSVTDIDEYIFSGCTNLEKVVFGAGVTDFNSYYSLEDCEKLSEITICANDMLIYLHTYVTLRIGKNVTAISEELLNNYYVRAIIVDPENEYYSSDEYGVLFNKDKSVLVRLPQGSEIDSYYIPDSVKTIGEKAFYDCDNLKSLIFGSSVEIIGDFAFDNCYNLRHVTLSANIKDGGSSDIFDFTDGPDCDFSLSIGAEVAEFGDFTVSFKLFSLIQVDEDNEFFACDEQGVLYSRDKTALIKAPKTLTGTYTVPDGVTSIGDYAFYGCNGISLTIPGSVKSIGESAFPVSVWNYTLSLVISEDVTEISADLLSRSYNTIQVETGNQHFVCDDSGVLYDKEQTMVLKSPTAISGDYSIADSVQTICKKAFGDCRNLTGVAIPEGVQTIETSAFYNCSKLTGVTIPASVQTIGGYAFYNCSTLTEVIIPEGVQKIEPHTFHNCSKLTAVTIPAGVQTIGEYAFYNCSALTGVTIPASVQTIGGYAFYNCSALTEAIIPEGVQKIEPYTFDNCSKLTAVTIPASVQTIGEYAFYYCSALAEVAIPGSVTTVGDYAFYRCSGVTDLTISDGVTSIGENSFEYCSGIKTLTIPDSVKSVGKYAFSRCTGLMDLTISGDAASIGQGAFQYCSQIKTVTIIEGVKSIGYQAFYDCSNLNSVTILCGGIDIGSHVFEECDKLNAVYIDDLADWCTIRFSEMYSNPLYYAKKLYLNDILATDIIIPAEAEKVNNYAFYNCRNLTGVSIENGVTDIGSYAFYNCSELMSVSIPNSMKNIASSAFNGCGSIGKLYLDDISSLFEIVFDGNDYGPVICPQELYVNGELTTDIVIPEGTESIGASAFKNWDFIESITIPDSVTSVGDYAFYDCDGLTEVTIGSNVSHIGDDAFERCTNLQSIWVNENNPHYSSDERGVLFNKDKTTLIHCPRDLSGEYVIPDGVAMIEEYAFAGVYGLTGITIPSSVSGIGRDAFKDCSRLNNVYISDLSAWCGISFGDSGLHGIREPESVGNPLRYAENLYVNGTIATNLVIPDGVECIPDNAFHGFVGLASISIPDSVTSVGDGAFYGCINLTEISIPERVRIIDAYAFYGCSSLSDVVIDSGAIRDYAFSQCSSVNRLVLGDSVTEIRYYAFRECTELTDVTIPGSVSYVSYGAFADNICTFQLKIGKAHTSDIYYNYDKLIAFWVDVENELFSSDENGVLFNKDKSVLIRCPREFKGEYAIPDGVERINESAFADCSGLTAVKVPGSVQYIGERAFNNCSSLTDVYISDVAAWCNISFASYYEDRYWEDETSITTPMYYAKNLYVGEELTTDLVIPEGVTHIKPYAFRDFNCLTSVTIPKSMETIGANAFSSCTNLSAVHITDMAAWCGISFGNENSNPLCYAKKLYVDGSYVTDLELPEGLQQIGNYAFYNCTDLSAVMIPEGMESIGNYAFYGCTALSDVTIPEGLLSIGEWAFGECSNVASVTVPGSLKSIGFNTFTGCDPTYTLVIGRDTTDAGYALENFAHVLDVVLVDPQNENYTLDENGVMYNRSKTVLLWCPREFAGGYTVSDGVTFISSYAFANCNTLSSIKIPDSVIYIGNSAFADCANLNYVKIGAGVRGVGYNAFGGCTALETVTFMGDTKIVDENAFPDSKNLNHVHFLCDMPVIKKGAFGNAYSNDDYYDDDYYYDDYYGEESTEFLPTDVLLCYPEEAQKWNTYAYNISGTEYSHVITVDGAVATDKLVCSCGEVLRVTESHNHTYVYSDNGDSTHSEACSACGDIRVDHEPHTFEDGMCIYCNALEPKDDAQLIFSSKTLSLRNYICFDFTVHNSVLEHYDSWFVVFERYDHELDTIVTTRVESEDFFNHQLLEIKLCSYQMADPFTATLYAVKDGTPYRGEVYTNSVAGYVNENIVNATSDAHRTLFANLVTYGAKAQIYMNYNTENLADAGLGEYASYVTTTIPTAETVFSETNNGLKGVTLTRTALGIASAVELQFALNVSVEYNANKIYAEMVYTGSNGQTVTERVEGSDFLDYGIFYVCIFRSLTAVDGRTPVEVTVYDQSGNAISETWTYSIASYLDGSPLTGTALDTLHALINYFDAAEAYFSGVQQVEAT